MALKSFLAKLGLYDPDEKRRDEELKSKLTEATESLIRAQRKLAEASVRTIRNRKRLTQTMSEASGHPRNKTADGNI